MSQHVVSRARERLTDTAIRRKFVRKEGAYHDGDGLYLIVRGSACNWVYRYTLDGKAHTMGLGPYPEVSLSDARLSSFEARQLLKRDRLDPLAHRKETRTVRRAEAAANAMTFDACTEQYITDHRAGWRNEKHKWQWSNSLQRFASPIIGALPAAAIDTAAIQKVLAPIWTEIPETASKLRGRMEKILDWAKVMGYRSGDNPASWKGNLQSLFPSKSNVRQVEHHPALPYAALPAFMATLRQQNSVSAHALEFAILTAARTGEVIGAKWSEFDLDPRTRTWTVPARRMKMHREHRVHLCDRAMTILGEMGKVGCAPDAFVFPGRRGKPLSNMAMMMQLRRMGRGDLTVHGFRSTFRDWCAEQTAFASEVAEMALAHVVGNKVEAAYRRGDMFEKRRQLADNWSKYCSSAVAAPMAAE